MFALICFHNGSRLKRVLPSILYHGYALFPSYKSLLVLGALYHGYALLHSYESSILNSLCSKVKA